MDDEGEEQRYSGVRELPRAGERGQLADLANELCSGLFKGDFGLYYQPQMHWDGKIGTLCGVEALMRWPRPKGNGFLRADRVVELLESKGLCQELSRQILSKACAQLSRWRKMKLPVPALSVNLSALGLADMELPSWLDAQLPVYGLVPSDLTLELTECSPLYPLRRIAVVMQTLHDKGFRMSIDDLGSGYAGFGRLSLPINEFKLDRSLIEQIESSLVAREMLSALVGVGRKLGLKVVAEGVETEAQAELLRAVDCPVVQGFYFSPPLPAQAFEQWIAAGCPIAGALGSVGGAVTGAATKAPSTPAPHL